ncbi:MAG: hypothetical protein ACFE85_09450 [Candidatus Hodarchaeota archaeon]
MPVGIYLYEIDKSFGPNVLAEYYLDQENKIKDEILKDFEDKHIQKEFSDTIYRKNDLRYYSSKIDAKSINRDNLFLGFIFKIDEDLVSLKSIFDNIATKIIKEFSQVRGEMEQLLKAEFNSIFTLMEKLKESALIKDTINDKTKKMLDDGKLQEARELIDLGEDIPEKLSEEIKLADQLLKNKLYKKAKKSFIKAAELAETIQENDIVSFLISKGEQVGKFPDLIKERDAIYKEIESKLGILENNQLHLYHDLIKPVERLLNISNSFEESELIENSTELLNNIKRANQIGKELFNLDKKIKELLDKSQTKS